MGQWGCKEWAQDKKKNKRGIFALGICSNEQSVGQIALESVIAFFFVVRCIFSGIHYLKERGALVLPSIWLEGFQAYIPLHVYFAVLWPFHVMTGPIQAAHALAHVSCLVFAAVMIISNPLTMAYENGYSMWAIVGIIACAAATGLRIILHQVSMLHRDKDERMRFHIVRAAGQTYGPQMGVVSLVEPAAAKQRAQQFININPEVEKAAFDPKTSAVTIGGGESPGASFSPAFLDLEGDNEDMCPDLNDPNAVSGIFASQGDFSLHETVSMTFHETFQKSHLPPPPPEEPDCCNCCCPSCSGVFKRFAIAVARTWTHFCGVPTWWLGAPRPPIMRARPSPVTSVRVENLSTHIIAMTLCLACFAVFTGMSHNQSRAWCEAHIKILNGSIFFGVLLDIFIVQPLWIAMLALFRFVTSEVDPENGDSIVQNEAYPIPYEWRYVGLPPPIPAAKNMKFRTRAIVVRNLIRQRRVFHGVFGTKTASPDAHTARLVRRLSHRGLNRDVTEEDLILSPQSGNDNISP